MKFWHGGNLDDYSDVIAQKNGRHEYGPGLYLTTKYDVVTRYTKGSRKLYIVTVNPGNEISDVYIHADKINEFIRLYVKRNLQKMVVERLKDYLKNGQIKGNIFLNCMVNTNAIKSTDTINLRQFLIDNGIDYEMVDNAFGFGEKMMVLFNMKKIANVERITSHKQITTYDF